MILWALFLLLIVGVIEGAVILYYGHAARSVLLTYLQRAEQQQRECLALLKASKEMARSSDKHHKDAQALLHETKQVAPVLVEAVKQMPDVTAERVIEKIKGDSGVL